MSRIARAALVCDTSFPNCTLHFPIRASRAERGGLAFAAPGAELDGTGRALRLPRCPCSTALSPCLSQRRDETDGGKSAVRLRTWAAAWWGGRRRRGPVAQAQRSFAFCPHLRACFLLGLGAEPLSEVPLAPGVRARATPGPAARRASYAGRFDFLRARYPQTIGSHPPRSSGLLCQSSRTRTRAHTRTPRPRVRPASPPEPNHRGARAAPVPGAAKESAHSRSREISLQGKPPATGENSL